MTINPAQSALAASAFRGPETPAGRRFLTVRAWQAIDCPERQGWVAEPGQGPATEETEAESACKPGSVEDGHSSRPAVADGLKRPTRFPRGPRVRNPIWSCSGWGLPCRSVTRLAVRSYRTVSPLPDPSTLPKQNGGHRRSTLCCTFRRLAPPRRYLAPCPVEPGLSSPALRQQRPSGRLRRGAYEGPLRNTSE